MTSQPTPSQQGGNSGVAPTRSKAFVVPSPANAVPDVIITLPGALPVVPASASAQEPKSSNPSSPAAGAGAGSSPLPAIVSASPLPSPSLGSSAPSNSQVASSQTQQPTSVAPLLPTETVVIISRTRTSDDEAPGITIIPINTSGQAQNLGQVLAVGGEDEIGTETVVVQEKLVTVTATKTETATATVTAIVTETVV